MLLKKNIQIIAGIEKTDPTARIIVMGDFNDDPQSKSLQKLTQYGLYNPMEVLLTREKGTLGYRGDWFLFDQIVISYNFLKGHNNDFRFNKASIFAPQFLKDNKGLNKGFPFRSFVGKKYQGGYSDHFPVFALFSIKKL